MLIKSLDDPRDVFKITSDEQGYVYVSIYRHGEYYMNRQELSVRIGGPGCCNQRIIRLLIELAKELKD